MAQVLEVFASEKRCGCYKTDGTARLAQANGQVSEDPVKICVPEKRFSKARSLTGSESHFSIGRVSNNQIKHAELIRLNFQSVASAYQIIEGTFGRESQVKKSEI